MHAEVNQSHHLLKGANIRLHYLEDEFSDITGWNHHKWHKDVAQKKEE